MVQETLRDILQSVFEEAFGSSAMMICDLALIDLLASIGMRVEELVRLNHNNLKSEFTRTSMHSFKKRLKRA